VLALHPLAHVHVKKLLICTLALLQLLQAGQE
jgi:hypothetical protein